MTDFNPQDERYKPNWDKKAYHNEQGMYVMPEPDNSIPDAFLDKSGLFLPKPKGKEITRIIWDIAGIYTECTEEPAEIIKLLNSREPYFTLTNAVLGTPIYISRANAIVHILVLDRVFKDMEAERMNVQAYELNKRLQTQELNNARLKTLKR